MAEDYNAEMLEKVERMSNLESVVAEQRMRIEKLKTTYETLKIEHLQLQDACQRKDSDIIGAREEAKKVQEECQDIIKRLRSERDSKIQECEELRTQVVTPSKLEMMRIKLLEEIEEPYRERFQLMEAEINNYRSDFNKLRYDYSFLKSEYEHEQTQHKQIVEELQAQYEIDVTSLRKERDALLQKQQQEVPSDAQRARNLQRENTQLHMKLKNLLAELEEIRSQRENAGLQSDHVSRLQARQVSELTAKCKSLETERDSLQQQCKTLQTELEKKHQEQDQLTEEIHQLEKENMSIKSKLEEASHKHKVEISNLRMSLTKNKGDLERERDELQAQIDNCNHKIEVLKRTIDHLKNSLDEKEKEVSKRVQEVKEKEWEKIAQLEQSKLQLETSLAQMERAKLDLDAACQDKMEAMEEKARLATDNKIQMEKECSVLKSQIKENENLANELEREKASYQELKQKHQQLQNHYQSVTSSEQQLMSSNDRLKNSVELLNNELGVARADLQRLHDDHINALEHARQQAEDEKTALEKHISEIENKHKEAEEKSRKGNKILDKKRKKYKQEIFQLQDKIQLLEKKEQQLILERDSEKRKRELEAEKNKRQLEKLSKKQSRFRNMLNNSQPFGGPAPIISSSPLPFNVMPFNVTTEQDRQQRDIALVRERVEELESTQREMSNILQDSLPVTS
ncbi:centrosomal protein of 83 kDa-like [Actinia tenebrosa]|uniref:Centrosomal protein of 83 kDa-like n=1 Tax=Actinia tenebrosa TaxID=6105 RepID=A0A6P8I571_ACTTE|nr:centrosomal protein of 83 kDa-like [Actinia tenebrosa]